MEIDTKSVKILGLKISDETTTSCSRIEEMQEAMFKSTIIFDRKDSLKLKICFRNKILVLSKQAFIVNKIVIDQNYLR